MKNKHYIEEATKEIEETLNRFDNVLTEVNPRDTEYSKIAKDFTKQIMKVVSNLLKKQEAEIRQEFVEKIQGEYTCIGPTDEIHRCSYGHCKRCGECDVISDILAKL